MNAKISVTLFTILLAVKAVNANTPEEAGDSIAHDLQEVVVTAKSPRTQLVGSTLTTTIQGSGLAGLGNALDVLAQLPMIVVEDNNVGIVGKSDVEIFIDGRPLRDEAELRQLQSSNLKKVELNLAPGAAYGSNTDAVLKIMTRRSFIQGLSLTDQFQLQRRRRWSVMDYLSFNYRCGDWELFAEGTINRNNSLAKGSTLNTLVVDGRPKVIGATQHNSYPSTVGVVKAGFNYSKGARSMGAYYRYNPERGSFVNLGNERIDDEPVISREIDKNTIAHSHLASLYYETVLGDKSLIHFDGDYKRSASCNNVSTNYPESDYRPEIRSDDERSSTFLAGKLYLELPFWRGDLVLGT